MPPNVFIQTVFEESPERVFEGEAISTEAAEHIFAAFFERTGFRVDGAEALLVVAPESHTMRVGNF